MAERSQEAAVTSASKRKLNPITFADILIWLFMLATIVVVLYPILMIISGSFSNSELLLRGQVGIVPKGFTFKNYIALFTNKKLWPAYMNTIFYTVVATAASLFFNISCAYPLSKRTFVGRRKWNFMLLFTMLFSGGMIPSFILCANVPDLLRRHSCQPGRIRKVGRRKRSGYPVQNFSATFSADYCNVWSVCCGRSVEQLLWTNGVYA